MYNNKYLEDKANSQDHRSQGGMFTVDNILKGSAIAAGSLLAYKSGILKPVVKKVMKQASESKPIFAPVANDLRKWLASDAHMPEESIFRADLKDTVKNFAAVDLKNAKDVLKDATDLKTAAKKIYDTSNAKTIIEATGKDIDHYKYRLNNTFDNLNSGSNSKHAAVRNTHHNTSLLRDIKDSRDAMDMYSDNFVNGREALRTKMDDSIIKDAIMSDEDALKELNKKGYQKARLKDLFIEEIDEKGNVTLIEKTKFNFSEETVDSNMSARQEIESMLNSKVVTEKGFEVKSGKKKQKMYQRNENYKDMVVDENIFVDEAGDVIDLRARKTSNQEFVRNLATEWQIPVIGVNPLRMFGVDKIGKRTVKFASISEDTVAPFLTGVRGNTEKETIKNLKDEVEVLKGVREGVTIINGDVYRMSDDGIGVTKMDYKSKKEIVHIPKAMAGSTQALNQSENSLRKIGGMSKRKFEDYAPEDGWKYKKQQIAKFFDVGYQESAHVKDSFDSMSDLANPDSYMEKVISKVKPEPYKKATYNPSFTNMSNPNATQNADTNFIINKSTGLKDIYNSKFNKETVKNYFKQTVAGMNDYENVNRVTGVPYFVLERMNQTISSVGLGLSSNSTKNTMDTAKNLILKRFMPIYGAYQGWNLLNMIGEEDADIENDKAGNINQHIMKGVAKADVLMHKAMDKVGIATAFKNLQEITPGSEMIEELPGFTALNLHQTAEERERHWAKGYDPVRKGRFWSMNSTPFIGGKVQYYRANAKRRAFADAEYSDSQFGSRKERLVNLFDSDHYDKKHYYTRPYLMTSPAFEGVPLIGPTLAATVGKVVKPQRRMHAEYWNEDAPKSREEIAFDSAQDLGYMETFNTLTQESSKEAQEFKNTDTDTLAKVYNFQNRHPMVPTQVPMPGSDGRNEYNQPPRIQTVAGYTKSKATAPYSDPYLERAIQSVEMDRMGNSLSMYRTNSGAMRAVDLGSNPNQARVAINNNGSGLGQIMDAKDMVKLNSSSILTEEHLNDAKFANPVNPNSLPTALADQYRNTSNVAGMYGFMATGFVTGTPGSGQARIETSGHSRSFSRSWWSKELGGGGGDISEIFRRFVQPRRKDVHYYNPIKNRMPDWLPGENGFVDFQHGDAYSKIAVGEERLPGEGYERMNKISTDKLIGMEVAASTMGKTKEEMVSQLFHQDRIGDDNRVRANDKGSPTHRRIERELVESGMALAAGEEVRDDKNMIKGNNNLRMNDATSWTGQAIAQVKVVSGDTFREVVNSKAPLDSHQREVNWYLHNTNRGHKGYVKYVNEDDAEQTFDVGFNYSRKMYNSSMDTLKQARSEIKAQLMNGEKSRADLYSPLDKYRIIADVAPFSDEYRQMDKQMSMMDLNKEEMLEVREIRDRVKAQRDPLRLTEYKFQTAKVDKKKVKVGRQVDNETFMLDDGQEAIKLAGVNLKKTGNDKYNEAMGFLKETMGKGKKITIKVGEDKLRASNKDMLKTTKAVVYSDGMNINKELIKRGYAEEDKDDYSAAGVHARFNSLERNFGKAWETVAHFDSFANTKLLQVRSASEDYERRHVYNKDFKEWHEPIKDFLKPFADVNINRTGGVLVGAGVGYMFGDTKYGKLVGATIGAVSILGGKGYKAGYEATTGEKWIPQERRKERELNDYMDKLKFAKNRRLFEVYSQKALEEDGIDVKKMLAVNKHQGRQRKKRARAIENVKVNAKKSGDFDTGDFEDVGVKFNPMDKIPSLFKTLITGGKDRDILVEQAKRLYNLTNDQIEDGDFGDIMDTTKATVEKGKRSRQRALNKTVNEAISEDTNNKKVFELSKNAMKAVEYYNESEKTMHGWDPGEELTNMISALPKVERQYFRHFAEAPESERAEILENAPKFMRRALQSSYGMQVDEKDDLTSYFSEHYLPDEDWDGWQEEMDLESMKVKMIQSQNLEMGSFDMWEDDKIKADMYGPTDIPNQGYRTRDIATVKEKLSNVLGNAGYKDLDLSFTFGTGNSGINVEMYEENKHKYEAKLKERLGM